MSIEFHCLHCGKYLRVKDESGGRRAKCPACGQAIDIPVAPATLSTPVAVNEVNPESGTKACPHCRRMILSAAKKCKHCKQWIEQPQAKLPAIQEPATPASTSKDMTSAAIFEGIPRTEYVMPDRIGVWQNHLALDPDETLISLRKTNENVPNSVLQSGMLEALTLKYDLILTNKRIIYGAVNKAGGCAKMEIRMDQVVCLENSTKLFTRILEIVYDANGEQLLKIDMGVENSPPIKRYCECIVAYVKALKGGFCTPTTVATTSIVVDAKKRQMELAQQERQRKNELVEAAKRRWVAETEDLRSTLPARLKRGEEVSIGCAHPDFDEWTFQNVPQGETIIARCYGINESLVITTEKTMLLKKGAAKAAVSASGGGSGASTVGALAGLFLGEGLGAIIGGAAAGLAVDVFMGAKGVIAKTIDFYNITSVDCTQGALWGHFEITYPGSGEVRTGGAAANAISENVFQFPKEMYEHMVHIANEIRRRVKEARSPSIVVQKEVVDDPLSQLKKLSELRDMGVLSSEEFEGKKKELLSRI